jgi:hypothetical protein
VFYNISVISWRSVLLVEETWVLGENTDLPQVTDKLYHIMLYTSPWSRFELTTSVLIGTDCIGSCKSIYHTITATTAPNNKRMLIKVIVSEHMDKNYQVCQWLAAGRWFSPISSTNKTDRQDITELLLKVTLNTITITL